MNDAELRVMQRRSVRLATIRFLGDGQWHTLVDLWRRLQRDGNPSDNIGMVANALTSLEADGIVESRPVYVPEYRLVSVVEQ